MTREEFGRLCGYDLIWWGDVAAWAQRAGYPVMGSHGAPAVDQVIAMPRAAGAREAFVVEWWLAGCPGLDPGALPCSTRGGL